RARHAHAPRGISCDRPNGGPRARQLAVGPQSHYWIRSGNVTSCKVSQNPSHLQSHGREKMNGIFRRSVVAGATILACGLALAAPQISPDGKWIVYTVATPDMEANRNASDIWLVPTSGGAPSQLTQSGHDSSPVWSPDGKTIAFLSSRSGESQVYLLSLAGGEAQRLTKSSTGADLVKWSPDGKTIAFTSSVYPDCKDDDCNSRRDAGKEKNKVKA